MGSRQIDRSPPSGLVVTTGFRTAGKAPRTIRGPVQPAAIGFATDRQHSGAANRAVELTVAVNEKACEVRACVVESMWRACTLENTVGGVARLARTLLNEI
jgi:hypothetical protein